MLTKVLEVSKALLAAATAASAAAAQALIADQVITPTEWLTVAVAAVVGFGAVWSAKNRNQPTVAQAKAQHLAGE
jgi:ElaB/YqjD/DUF883 family membrane-anchored ribosome-binding protein